MPEQYGADQDGTFPAKALNPVTDPNMAKLAEEFRWMMVRRSFRGITEFEETTEGPFTIEEAESLVKHFHEFYDKVQAEIEEINKRLKDRGYIY